MSEYSTTAKLWLKVEAKTAEEARNLSKHVVDAAMDNTDRHGTQVSKSKIIWVREVNKKKRSAKNLQAAVNNRFSNILLSEIKGAIHPEQRKILELIQTEDIGQLTLREIGRRIGVEHPQTVKYHLLQLEQYKL